MRPTKIPPPGSTVALVGVSAALLLVGCGRPALMPTPVVFDGTGVDPIAEAPPGDQGTTTRVFYATDRTPLPADLKAPLPYSNERDFGLRLGVISVELAPHMTWPELHELSLRGKRAENPKPRVTSVDEIGPLWLDIPPLQAADVEDPDVAGRFATEVQAELDRSGLDEIFIFVHGFNTRFDDNAVIAAELHHYLGQQGVFMSYAWPSRGSLFAYSADKASARYSTRYFRLLLAFLANRTNARRINVLAHSAGAPIAVEGIRELCLMHHDEGTAAVESRYRLGQLVLVAPDMDLGNFENAIHDEIVGVPEHMAIYFSTRDKALDFSSWIYGFARLGEPLTALDEGDMKFLEDHPDVSLIDVAAAEKNHGSWLGHSYFHNDPWVSSDVIMLMRHGAEPAERGLVRIDDKPIWTFPQDFPERALNAARRLYPGDGAGPSGPGDPDDAPPDDGVSAAGRSMKGETP